MRLFLVAAGAFWKYLELTRMVTVNPFVALALPKRDFKHAIEPDKPTVLVMNDAEYSEILRALSATGKMDANTIAEQRMRGSARRLVPLVRLLGETGLRLGDALSMRLEDDGKAAFRVKGGRVRLLDLPAEALKHFKNGPRRPFADWKLKTAQAAVARVGAVLHVDGRLRHP